MRHSACFWPLLSWLAGPSGGRGVDSSIAIATVPPVPNRSANTLPSVPAQEAFTGSRTLSATAAATAFRSITRKTLATLNTRRTAAMRPATLAATSTNSTNGLESPTTAVDITDRDSRTSYTHQVNYAKLYRAIHADELDDGGRTDDVSPGYHVVGHTTHGNDVGYGFETAGGADHR